MTNKARRWTPKTVHTHTDGFVGECMECDGGQVIPNFDDDPWNTDHDVTVTPYRHPAHDPAYCNDPGYPSGWEIWVPTSDWPDISGWDRYIAYSLDEARTKVLRMMGVEDK